MKGIISAGAAGVALLLSGGCATVQTSLSEPESVNSGISYFLPKREMKLTAERKIQKPAELARLLAAKQTELSQLTSRQKELDASVKAQATLVAKLSSGSEAHRQANAALETDQAKLQITKDEAGKASAAVDQLQSWIATSGDGSKCFAVYSAKLELLPAMADTRMRLSADSSHNIFRDDDTKLKVSPEGLLTSANIIAIDRTGDIVADIAGAISGFGGGGAGMRALHGEEQPDTVSCDTRQIPKFAYQFDPTDQDSRTRINSELTNAGYPFRIETVPVASTGGNQRTAAPWGPSAFSFDDAGTSARGPGRPSKEPISTLIRRYGERGALFYRRPMPVTVVLRQCRSGQAYNKCVGGISDSDPVDAALVMLPQIGPLSYVPMRSSAFVKTIDDVTFDNGIVTSWNANRPSEVLEVVRLPVKVLSSIIQVPAQIFSLRLNQSTAAKGLAQAQEAEIKAQLELQELQQCIRTAQEEERSSAACFD